MKTKVIKFHKTGGPEVLTLETVDVDPPKAQEATIKNHAIGVNYIDTYFRTGLYPAPLPAGIGMEGAGVVEVVGPGVTHIKPGDRVAYGQGPLGSYSERRTMPAWQLVKIPDSLSFADAASIMLKGLTVQYLFKQTYKVSPGETILFHAAAGGVGLIACQWARHLGVKLIGTVSSDQKAKLAKASGAWATINYTKENISERLNELTQGEKVSVVYDSVGKSTWDVSLDCLRPRGLMVSFGNASGPVTGVNLGVLSQKSLYVTRPVLGVYADSQEKLNLAAQDLFDLVSQGIIKVEASQKFALSEAVKAHQILESRERMGSLVLLTDEFV